jgi:hypothetical protein
MEGQKRRSPGGWWLLLLIPVALAVALFYPAGGEYSEGIFVEGLAKLAEKPDDQLAEFATRLRFTGGTMAALAVIVAIACWFGLRSGWKKRLLEFDSSRILGFRGLFGLWFLWTFLAALVVASLVEAFSPLHGEPILVLGILALVTAVIGCLMYLAMVFGIRESRRLFRGK